jgi:hypothetical protein
MLLHKYADTSTLKLSSFTSKMSIITATSKRRINETGDDDREDIYNRHWVQKSCEASGSRNVREVTTTKSSCIWGGGDITETYLRNHNIK